MKHIRAKRCSSLALLVCLELACSKESTDSSPERASPPAPSDSKSSKGQPAQAAATREASRPDLSGAFADGLCALPPEAIAKALGSESVEVEATQTRCSYQLDAGVVTLIVHELGNAEVTHQLQSVQDRIEMGSIDAMTIGGAELPATWSSGARSELKLYGKERLVILKVFVPRIDVFDQSIPREKKDEVFTQRKQYARKLGDLLARRAEAS